MLVRYLPFALCFSPLMAVAQVDSAAATTPTSTALATATVVGYGQQVPLRRLAASVGIIDSLALRRFPDGALGAAVNTLPGVRWEERATASFRLSIRGSTLRSPFGVRNVKVYYHDIPFTEAGGSTPLNLLDPAPIGRIEVLKGPAGSTYGAGTGGVVRFENRAARPGTHAAVGVTVGSYGLRRVTATVETRTAGTALRAQYVRQTLDGYRAQSAMRRDVLTLDAELRPAADSGAAPTLAVHALYTDLDYQIPGGLTRAQFAADPRQARPDAGPGRPGTVTQRAGYASRTGLLGLTHTAALRRAGTLTSTLYGTGTAIATPFLVDLERSTAIGGGGRMVWRQRLALAGSTLRLAAGGEFQAGFERASNYQNLGGNPGLLRYDDEIRTATGFGFVQVDYELPAALLLTVGASYNRLHLGITRASAGYTVARDFRPEASPRVALLKDLGAHLSVFASVSTGFSPPSDEEVRPSDGSLNRTLRAERSTSYEIGARGTALHERLTFEVSAYRLELRQTIVARPDTLGTQRFTNAGTTHQLGLEAALSAWLVRPPSVTPTATSLRAWTSFAYQHYRFGTYQNVDGLDFSGRRLPGTAPQTLTAGLDLTVPHGFYVLPSVSHQARLPLNEANSAYSAGYWTLSTRAGYRHRFIGYGELEIFGSIDNATDTRYSLGPDLNAFGERYYQSAPGRSFSVGVVISGGR
jgi:iron complex outermembrane recepter protein